jgi:hypothetical protein
VRGSECSFLLDENVGREVAHQPTKHGHHVDLVIDILAPGISAYSDILPYAQEHDLVIVTKTVQILARCYRVNMKP